MDDHDNDPYPLISATNNISSNSSSSSSSTKSNTTIINEKANALPSMDQESLSQSPERSEFPANHSDYPDSDSSDGEAVIDENVDAENVDAETVDHTGVNHVDEWLSLGSSLMDSLMGWLEVPPVEGVISVQKQHNVATYASNNKNQTILDIPLQFIDLLTYPEIDSKASKKASFAGLFHFFPCLL
ncbi:1207_t:CDS:1, partial [Cetraspora pellucida]